jgi:hypothetical protein
MACVLASTMALISASDGPPLHAVRTTTTIRVLIYGFSPVSSLGQC